MLKLEKNILMALRENRYWDNNSQKYEHVCVLFKKHDPTMQDMFGAFEECKLKYEEEKRNR